MQSHTVAVKPDISIHFVQDGNATVSTLPGYDPGGTVEGTPQGMASTAADPQNGAKKRPRGRPRKGPKDNSAIDVCLSHLLFRFCHTAPPSCIAEGVCLLCPNCTGPTNLLPRCVLMWVVVASPSPDPIGPKGLQGQEG